MKCVNTALALLALACCAPSAHAAESYDSCTGFINSLPATISTPGTWCLNKTLSTALASGPAIKITANDVTIDCNDFRIVGTADATAATTGITAVDRHDTEVRNCHVRGFRTGLLLTGSGQLVEDNRFVGNLHVGIEVRGDGAMIRRNLVLDTGGSTRATLRTTAYGMIVGDNADVVDNTIDGVQPAGDTTELRNPTGIRTHDNLSGTISGNRIRSLVAGGGGVDRGIDNVGNDGVVIVDNVINGRGYPGGAGIQCTDDSGTLVRNIIIGFTSGIAVCTNGGYNVVGS
jgi:hypothetical protein